MLPEIAEVILIYKALSLTQAKTAKLHLVGIISKPDPANSRYTIAFPMDNELVQVEVSPPHDYLYRIVQVSNSAITANQQSSPDGWADLSKP